MCRFYTPQKDTKPASRKYVENRLNACKSTKNRRSVPSIPSVILMLEKVNHDCDILSTTYKIRANNFLLSNCVKLIIIHIP
jgi:hypothetical protein